MDWASFGRAGTPLLVVVVVCGSRAPRDAAVVHVGAAVVLETFVDEREHAAAAIIAVTNACNVASFFFGLLGCG